jgi:rare lipoprotein A
MNSNAMTAAHRTLPFGTKLKVTHGDRSVVVTINDRGPFVRGRVLDLSTGAARAIGLTSAGVGHVTAEVM